MFLLEAIEQIESLNSNATIWIEHSKSWSPQSLVLVAEESEDGGSPEKIPASYEYFLEVFIVADFVNDLAIQNKEAIAERVIHYAINDA